MDPDEPSSRIPPRRLALMGCDVMLALAAAVAVASLLLEHGFYEPPVRVGVLHAFQVGALAVFMLDRIARLVLAPKRRLFFKENWIDYALIAGAGAAAVAAERFETPALSAGAIYVVVTQVYILSVIAIRVVGFQVRVAGAGVHPIWMLIGSFVLVILFGTGLLMLPRAAPPGIERVTFTDALFTATSATCVTGLLVRDTAEGYAPFGQTVIGVMIQLGGLGIMLFGTVFAMLTRRSLTVRESLLAGEMLSDGMLGRIGRMAKFVVLTTVCVELAGALLMWPMWTSAAGGGAVRGGLYSLFHSISAFCNAGFALRSDSMVSLRGHWQILGVMAPLIVLGGAGFPVLYDLSAAAWRRLRRAAGRQAAAPVAPLSLHTRLVVITSLVLLAAGAAGLILVEWAADPGATYGAPLTDPRNPQPAAVGTALGRMGPGGQVKAALFQSVSARTAGFNTVEMNALSDAGKFWMCLLMFVGGSPASTAGGMKTVTLAVIVLGIVSVLRRRERTEGFHRTVAESFVRKAVVLGSLYASLVVVTTLLLSIAMRAAPLASGQRATFVQVLFEACSACGTVGLSCGVTGSLTMFGKYVVIAAMFIGRLGPLTLLLAMTAGVRPARFAYAEEEVILG